MILLTDIIVSGYAVMLSLHSAGWRVRDAYIFFNFSPVAVPVEQKANYVNCLQCFYNEAVLTYIFSFIVYLLLLSAAIYCCTIKGWKVQRR